MWNPAGMAEAGGHLSCSLCCPLVASGLGESGSPARAPSTCKKIASRGKPQCATAPGPHPTGHQGLSPSLTSGSELGLALRLAPTPPGAALDVAQGIVPGAL